VRPRSARQFEREILEIILARAADNDRGGRAALQHAGILRAPAKSVPWLRIGVMKGVGNAVVSKHT
jgi:hypothetical protein